MSMLLFLSRIYDKEAPFITCKSLSGEVHTQHNDKKDFHNLSVWQIKDALMEAYKIGYEKDEKC